MNQNTYLVVESKMTMMIFKTRKQRMFLLKCKQKKTVITKTYWFSILSMSQIWMNDNDLHNHHWNQITSQQKIWKITEEIYNFVNKIEFERKKIYQPKASLNREDIWYSQQSKQKKMSHINRWWSIMKKIWWQTNKAKYSSHHHHYIIMMISNIKYWWNMLGEKKNKQKLYGLNRFVMWKLTKQTNKTKKYLIDKSKRFENCNTVVVVLIFLYRYYRLLQFRLCSICKYFTEITTIFFSNFKFISNQIKNYERFYWWW